MLRIMVGIALCLLSCRRNTFVSCTDATCARGERCDKPTGVCIIDRKPILMLSPVAGVQTQPTTEVTGTATDDVAITRAEYSLDDGGTWTRATLDGTTVRASVPLPALDSESAFVSVRITDTGDQPVIGGESFTVDRVGPQVTLLEPLHRVGGVSTTVVARAVDGAGPVPAMRLVYDGQTFPMTELDGGIFSTVFALPQGRNERLPVSVTATDVNGNESSLPAGIDVATLGPAFDLIADGGVVSATPRSILFRSVLPTSGVTATWRGQPVGVDASVPNIYSVVLSIDAGATVTSAPLLVSGVDSAGSQGSSTLMVPVDAVGPTVRFVSPANGALWGGDGVDAGVVSLEVADTAGVAQVAVDFGDGAGFRMATGPTWSVSIPLPRENGVSHTLRARAVDLLGNISELAGPTVVVDTVAPTVTFVGPTGVIGGPNSAMVDAVVNATDNRANSAVTVEIFDFDGVSGAATGTGPFRRTVAVPMVDYLSRSLRARARDMTGNTSAEATAAVFVDRVAPQVMFQAPTPGTVINLASPNAGASFPVQLRSTDASPTVQYYLRVMGGAGDGVDRMVAATSNVNTSAADNGTTYSLAARAVDQAGNESSVVMATIVVDRVAPTVTFQVPTPNQIVNLASPGGGASFPVQLATNRVLMKCS